MDKTICIFGDSIAWWAYDEQGWWVSRLRKYFEDNDDYNTFVYNQGIVWDNINKLLARFKTEFTARNPQIVIFAIGKNDSQYVGNKNNPIISIEKFQNNLEKLIAEAREFDFLENIVFIGLAQVNESKVSPIPWLTNTFADNDNIVKYDSIIRTVCNKYQLPYIELINSINKKDLDEDWLHPNSQGHNKIFMRVRDFLIENM